MLSTTLGQILVNEALPPDMRDYGRVLDKKGSAKLFNELALKYPEKYREVAKKLSDIGSAVSTESGGYSFGIKDLKITPKTQKLKDDLQKKIDEIVSSNMSDEEKQKKLISTVSNKTEEVQKTLYEEAVEAKNPLAMQIHSGSKGNPSNLRSVLAGDLLYEDAKNRTIPIPVMRSYAQGLSGHEYWAGTFGTRKGVIDLKFATQDAGAFSKQLNQATHRLVITGRDAEHKDDNVRGVPFQVDDPDNEGALLAQDVGGMKRNTIITPKVMGTLKAQGIERILVRSPMTGGPEEGGLYSMDVGVRERGGLSAVGDNVGMAASQGIAEPISQGALGAKHKGGVAGQGTAAIGFKVINQLAQVPKTYTGGASHAQTDGKVGAIYDAPAGGKYVMINGQRHYVSTGLEPKVKSGDTVEAGDVISKGLPNPSEIVAHKGVGEGRRYFVNTLRDVMNASGMSAHRRNMELIARGLINHVKLTDNMGDYTADDVVPYDVLEHSYQPRDGHTISAPKSAKGKYLERPVLHYSVGTRITPSVVKELDHFNIKNVIVHPEKPPFEPIMIRAMENLQHDPDWMTRQLGSGLKKGLLTSAHRGLSSNELGTSFVPSLARAVDFGKGGLTKGWKPSEVVKVPTQ